MGTKCFAVKTLGELVKTWREGSGLTHPELARRIGHGVKYQNLQQLEGGKAKHPRYISHLARAMGTTVENLLALRLPPLLEDGKQPAAPEEAAAGVVLNDMQRRLLVAFDALIASERATVLQQIEKKAAEEREREKKIWREKYGLATPPTREQLIASMEEQSRKKRK